MKPNQINYIKAKVQNTAIIELENVVDLCKYIEQHNVKEVFIFDNANKFGVLSHQFILQINSNGYETIEDAKVALLNKFPTAEDFYDAKKEGLSSYELYEMKTKFGIPMVLIVLAGGKGTLKTILGALEYRIPVIVVAVSLI